MFKLDVIPSPADERDLFIPSLYKTELLEEYDPYKELFPIRDQGAEGSCSAYTAACVKEWQEWKENGVKIPMSVDFIYTKRGNLTSPGMTPRETMQILANYGSLPSNLWRGRYARIANERIASIAAKFKISGYGRVESVPDLKSAIVKHGIGYFAIPVYNYSPMPWTQYPGEQLQGGHALAVVGWTKLGFVLRNSWGAGWGNRGYTIFPYKDWGKQYECWFIIDAETKALWNISRKMRRKLNRLK